MAGPQHPEKMVVVGQDGGYVAAAYRSHFATCGKLKLTTLTRQLNAPTLSVGFTNGGRDDGPHT